MKGFLISIIISLPLFCHAQFDTLGLFQEVDNLRDDHARRLFLEKLYAEDGKFRGTETNKTLDLQHLISISYYINKYGHPTEAIHGEPASTAPWAIWAHAKYRNLNLMTFPIILKAFEANELTEKKLRGYCLRVLYDNLYDDELYMELPLQDLYDLLGVNTGNTISIAALIAEMARIKELIQIPKKEIQNWGSAPRSKTVTINGIKTEKTYYTNPVEIFTLENGDIYYRKIFGDSSYDPVQLTRLSERQFKFKDQKTEKYFEIDKDGNLAYRDKQKIIMLHPASTKSP
jgi:hypothetical protein